MTTTGIPEHSGHTHDGMRITHIRHGELTVLLELASPAAQQLAAAKPDQDGNWPELDPNARAALFNWLISKQVNLFKGPIGLFNGRVAEDEFNDAAAPFLKADGKPRELYPLGLSGEPGRETLTALYTVNLESWIPDPWSTNDKLLGSIEAVAGEVKRLNQVLRPSAVDLLDREGQALPYRVVGVAPNWLSAGSNGCACAGPGGHPVTPAKEDVANRKFQPGDMTEAVKAALANLSEKNGEITVDPDGYRGKGISIAVIDSWPVGDDFFGAVRQKVTDLRNAREERSADLLEGVLTAVSAKPPRDVIKGTSEVGICIHRHGCDGPLPANMNFADHGLFIAGILHEIAPEATLRIYRAFNEYGCSTADLITKAVSLAVYDAKEDGNPLVINCSFSVGPETHMMDDLINHYNGADKAPGQWELAYKDGKAWIDKVGEDRPAAAAGPITLNIAPPAWTKHGADGAGVPDYQDILGRLKWLDELKALRALFGPLWDGHVLPVAAAGNDSCRHGHRDDPDGDRVVPPRFPAAFDEVLGVSAVIPRDGKGKTWEPVEYTNNDDIVIERVDGVSAMGGYDGLKPESRDYRGMIGPYVSADLEGGNKYGHALWAGTSFATPVVAALAACVWSELINHQPHINVNGRDIVAGIVGRSKHCDNWTPGDPRRLVNLMQRSRTRPLPWWKKLRSLVASRTMG